MRFQRGPRDVRSGRAARDADDAPRAYGSQCGAPRPTNAGTRYTSPLSVTLRASFSMSADFLMMPSPSRSHCVDCARDEHAAFGGVVDRVVPSSTQWSSATDAAKSDALRAGVEQNERAGAVGALGHARA